MFSKACVLLFCVSLASASAMPSLVARHRRSYAPPAAPVLAAPALAAVAAVAAVPTLTAVHSQRLVPQAPALHTVASPTTLLQTVQTGNAIVGHAHVGDQVVGKTADVEGYAFKSEVRHDAPVYAPAAPLLAGPLLAAPAPLLAAPVAAAPAPAFASAPVQLALPASLPLAPPVAAAPVLAAQPVVGAPLPLALPAYKKA